MAKWLYNGIEAPAIPDSLKDHPRLALTTGGRLAVFHGEPAVTWEDTDSCQLESLNGKIDLYNQNGDKSGWQFYITYNMGAGKLLSLTPVWTNFDLKRRDGSVYMYGSEPVHVSPVPINPALLVQSFFSGQAVGTPEETGLLGVCVTANRDAEVPDAQT